MSHTVHPYAHRLGINRDWKSRWFGRRGKYSEYLRGDVTLREYLNKRLKGSHVAGVDIERNEKLFRIIIKTSRPGLIIGRSGEGIAKLRADILKTLRSAKVKVPAEFKLDIEEVRSPEANASIMAQMVAEGLEKRLPFRRVLKQAIEKIMATRGVNGARIYVGGRLGGADMARSETLKKGSVPLQTLRADVDFSRGRAHLPYGDIGVKVWIYKGELFEERGTGKQASLKERAASARGAGSDPRRTSRA